MTTLNSLTAIAEELEGMSDDDGERVHIRADELLINTINLLAPKRPEGGSVDRIIAAYEAVGKWYA